MRTYTNNLMAANGFAVPMGYGPVNGKAYAATAARLGKRVRNIALFFAAPFIGLAYLLAFPVVGFALLVWVAAKAVMKNPTARPIALALAAPFIGLAFVTVGPIAGLAAIVWYAARAVRRA